ncbi:MAG: adaptor protein MecA [Clostridia bacterium]|nr:adaptor protein MecA [Clostridia bacterium]
MQINSPAENRIVVELSPQDMIELDITYEDMDYSAIETRRVIWTLLDAAGKYLGRELDPSRKMIIEAMPLSSGGCILCFTMLDTAVRAKRSTLIKQASNLLCEFKSLDGLYKAAEECSLPFDCAVSSLYENDGIFRLIISSPFDLNLFQRHFCEFAECRKCENLEADYTREHWNLIAENDAVGIIKNQL